MKNIAINGFGRIGKTFLRTIMQDVEAQKEITVKSINIGPSENNLLDHFFKYDSIMGTFNGDVSYTNKILSINNHTIEIIAERDPSKINWLSREIDWVVDSSGKFTSREKASIHLNSGAKKVLIAAPAKDEDITIIPGINDELYNPKTDHIVSLGSCTTNCFAPMIKVVNSNFGIKNGFMSTIHAYTNNQGLLDSEHKDPRRGRAAAINIIPTSTGASKVITKIYPELAGKLQGDAIRVPVPIVSLVEFTFTTNEELTPEAINQSFEKSQKQDLKDIIKTTKDPLVSSDYIGSPYSCIIDGTLTKTTGNMAKIYGWYDNEFGYSSRLKDFLKSN